MADSESKFWTFSKGLGAVVSTVATAVLIWYLTRTPVAPTYPQIGLTGTILDGSTQAPVVDALVTAAAGTSLANVKTDSQGRYSFTLAGTATGMQSATVDIVAGGYPYYRSAALSLTTGDNYVPIKLTHDAVASGGTPPAPAGPTAVPPSSISRIPPQISKVLPANFRKPEMTVRLVPK